ncbi:glycosyl hydrolase family 28-related protein [Taibaiella koreensis]|uniref:glycosyl hydrolase family 28-related protein n=1 Tax=Taibaiella koreensis TaxID=1268548 RepID=UPI0013C36A82|nr:glycosyl hydrolase family 28-related protein [Taibaiella koreensis]
MDTLTDPSNGLITLDGAFDGQTVNVSGYYTTNDGGGGTFYWDAGNLDSANDGTIFTGATPAAGRWKRIFSNTVDVKWFGAKGDNVTDDTVALQKALDFVAIHAYDLHLSMGTYRVTTPASGTHVLLLDLYQRNTLNIFGDGTAQSVIHYDADLSNPNANCDVFKILGTIGNTFEISNFSVLGNNNANVRGRGLSLEYMTTVTARNLKLQLLDTGIYLKDVLSSNFLNVSCNYCRVGVEGKGEGGRPGPNDFGVLPPNLINFTSGYLSSNFSYGAILSRLHSVTFLASSFEGNGAQGDSGTGGLYCYFDAANGANGININNCYFEGNAGGADITVDNAGSGTHTFSGNTFNRLNATAYTINNILINGNGSNPATFGLSRTKLVFLGNGFLVANSYVADAGRKTIQLQDGGSYGQFDVVEESNVYTGIVDAPAFSSKTPQLSETTRVKAFGRFNSDGSPLSSYNVASCQQVATGVYNVYYANPMSLTVAGTPALVGSVGHIYISYEDPTYIQVAITDTSAAPMDSRFTLAVY